MERESIPPLSTTEFLLLLQNTPYVGPKTLAHTLAQLAQSRLTPQAFLALPPKELIDRYHFQEKAAETFVAQRTENVKNAMALARTLRHRSVHLLSRENAAYPQRLEWNDASPPPLLYAVGNLYLLEDETRFTFALLVSNQSDAKAMARLEKTASELVESGGVPVTGHDRRPYQIPALVAHRADRPVIYVLDRGMREALGAQFDKTPFAQARIHTPVFEPQIDLALSPFRLDDHCLTPHLRRRDQLVIAMADILIALDVRKGGVLHSECLRAHRQGRPVFVAEEGRDGNTSLRALGCPELPSSTHWVEQTLERMTRHVSGEQR